MYKIHQISLTNFKFFYGENVLPLMSNNLLIYGENGSGKSSIYWALHSFLQSVFKADDAEYKKYFDPTHEQSLLNRFAIPGAVGSIIIDFIDEHGTIIKKTLAFNGSNTKSDNLVKEAGAASDFINYRVLSRIYDFTNQEKIDLFPLFAREILMFINFGIELGPGVTNAADWWRFLEQGQQPKTNIGTPEYIQFQTKMAEFNDQLGNYLLSILQTANEYLQVEFKQKLKIELQYAPGSYNGFMPGSTTKRNRITLAPKIMLKVDYYNAEPGGSTFNLSRPQSFLNEARLTAIALSIRFSILERNYIADASKILVLDDLLISLDMGNRGDVLKIILKKFAEYQIVMLTHDRVFYELAKHEIKRAGSTNWLYYEMYESVRNGIPQPFIKKAETYLEKAKSNFCAKEYEIAGNFLRKQGEAFCKLFLPKKFHFRDDLSPRDLSELIDRCLLYAKDCGLSPDMQEVFRDLDGHRKFVLNPASHDNHSVVKFNHEIDECIRTFEKLDELRFDFVIPAGEQFSFELIGNSDNVTYRFEIVLDEPAILIKEKLQDSVISQVKFGYIVIRDGVQKNDLHYIRGTLEQFYKRWYDKSDKAKDGSYWREIIQTSTGENLETLRAY